MRTIPKMFFLNGQLHKKLREIGSEDSVVAWNYPEEKRCRYPRSFVRQDFEYAYDAEEASKLLKVNKGKLRVLIAKNLIQQPSGTVYKLDNKLPTSVFFSEKDIMLIRDNLWDRLPKNKFGEPSVKTSLPSAGQLRADMRSESKLFILNDKKELVRVWRHE